MLVILIEKKGNVLGEVYYLVFNFFGANSELQFLISFSCMNNMCLFYL